MYCGCIATEWDHLFPRGLRVYTRKGGTSNKKIVPVCADCNDSLRMQPFFTVRDRAAYLYSTYKKNWKQPYTEEQIDRITWLRKIVEVMGVFGDLGG